MTNVWLFEIKVWIVIKIGDKWYVITDKWCSLRSWDWTWFHSHDCTTLDL